MNGLSSSILHHAFQKNSNLYAFFQIEKNFTAEILEHRFGAETMCSMVPKIWRNVYETVKMSSSWKSCISKKKKKENRKQGVRFANAH